MKIIKLFGNIDEHHRLQAQMPQEVPSGPVQLIILAPAEDDASTVWTEGLVAEWPGELADSRQDVYTLEDGKPVDGPR
jgi:hypothetical protein